MYNVKYNQVRPYLILLDAYFYNINFSEFFYHIKLKILKITIMHWIIKKQKYNNY